MDPRVKREGDDMESGGFGKASKPNRSLRGGLYAGIVLAAEALQQVLQAVLQNLFRFQKIRLAGGGVGVLLCRV